MRCLLRPRLRAALPLVLGVAAGQGFWLTQKQSCSRLVGPLFSAKCHGRQLEYQALFQTVGTATGSVLAALVGSWLELRRRRVLQKPHPTAGRALQLSQTPASPGPPPAARPPPPPALPAGAAG